MKIVYQITDEIIRSEIKYAVNDCIENGWIVFPSVPAMNEFIDDCVSCIIDKFELYETYTPDYTEIVMDLSKFYGYESEG